MNIKDYLHLYLGCVGYGSSGCSLHLSAHVLAKVLRGEVSFKPILRPLSDMTGDEGYEIAAMIYQDIYGFKLILEKGVDKLINDDRVGFIMFSEMADRVSLTVDAERGIDFYVDGLAMKVRQFDVTRYLLSKHFDLFGLIEAGLAIDKTTLGRLEHKVRGSRGR